jgi:hypothetical protein
MYPDNCRKGEDLMNLKTFAKKELIRLSDKLR